MKRIISLVLPIIFCFCILSQSALAASVGEEILFVAGQEETSVGGNSNSNTSSGSQSSAVSTNSRNNRRITNMSREIIEDIITNEIPIYATTDSTITMVWTDGVPYSSLQSIITEASDYSASGTSHLTNRWTPTNTSSIGNEIDVLKSEVIPSLDNVTPSFQVEQIPWFVPDVLDDVTSLVNFISTFGESGGYFVNVRIPGSSYITDFETFMTRYSVLREYMNEFCCEGEDVDVTYVVHYALHSTVEAQLSVSTPQTWNGTGMTHFWEIDCISAPDDGYTRTPFNTFASNSLRQTFYYPGEYRVTATQILENSYCNAFTWDKCEYLIIEETGQVIWKNESRGATIDASNDAAPMRDQGLWNIKYYNVCSTETVYAVKYDQIWNVTNNVLIGGQPAQSAWGNEYTTIRIE